MQEKDIKELISEFMKTKPETIDIIGYGSGVKNQTGYHQEVRKQIDIISTVKDSLTWHQDNKSVHPEEYNMIAMTLIKPILHMGTDITYLSDIVYNGNIFKVGVIDRFDFLHDLNNWSNFYMAGRMQKPVLQVTDNEETKSAIERNRLNALRTALILNTEKTVDETELFQTLCSLSYIGDIRMALNFENPNKVKNIVNGDLTEFRNIYGDLNQDLYTIKNDVILPNEQALLESIKFLPSCVLQAISSSNIDIENLKSEDFKTLREIIIKHIKRTNLRSSIAQPIKSASLNRFDNSFNYLKEKRKKYTLNK